MIAAVQVETSALDAMREKLKELDNLRSQLSTLTKRLLEADQTNLTLKTNLVKIQEACADVKKSKGEVSLKHLCLYKSPSFLSFLYNITIYIFMILA